jgi:hypothetical protein
MPGFVQKFFTRIGLLKYGIALSLLLVYLPRIKCDDAKSVGQLAV